MAITDLAIKKAIDTFKKVSKEAAKAGTAVSPKKLADMHGLYLHIKPAGNYWRYDYKRPSGTRNTLPLGVYPLVSLTDARKAHTAARELLAQGIDPSEAKKTSKANKAAADAYTFEVVAREYLETTKTNRAPTTQTKNLAWFKNDVFPHIGNVPIANIKAMDVLDLLRIMEARGVSDAAHNVRQLCGQVFRYGVRTGRCERDVTYDLKGALKPHKATSFAAITDPKKAVGLLRAIDGYNGHPQVRAALQLLALTFVRTIELRNMEWQEIDFEEARWTIPADKMKMDVSHIVPLSTQAVAILRYMQSISSGRRYVFPSLGRVGETRIMSENTINAALNSIGYGSKIHTGHGFRAMAKTIMLEVLREREDHIDIQQAHAVKDPNGRAYHRAYFIDDRKLMMQRWADYLDQLRKAA